MSTGSSSIVPFGRGATAGNGGGGDMDDVLKRLQSLETAMTELRIDVASMKASVVHLATKEDVQKIATLVANAESSMLKWMIGTVLTAAGVVYVIAKFYHG